MVKKGNNGINNASLPSPANEFPEEVIISSLDTVIFVSLNGNSASFGPKFDGSCANNGIKTKSGTFGVWKVLNMPTFVFVVLFAQKPPKLGPNGPHIG